MTLPAFLQIDANALKIISIVLAILTFFTILFYVWKLFRRFSLLDEMITRTHSWWIIFFLYILFFCIDPRIGQIGMALLGLGTLREFFEKFKLEQISKQVRWLSYLFVLLQYFVASQGLVLPTIVLIPTVFFVVITVWTLLFEPKHLVMSVPSVTLWALILTNYGMSHLALLLAMPGIPHFLGSLSGVFLYYLFLTQFNDVLQFIWGNLFGKHPIAPELSPKKTWEGFLGGTLTTTVLAYCLREITPFGPGQSVIVGASLGLTGYLGDLNISAIKRSLNIKNMGSVIPGHGGLLDRLDSITLSSLVYFYLIDFWFYS